MPNQIKKTNDGSDSLVSKQFGELYHSHHGSFQEAKHIFINNGIAKTQQNEINIFEMGFGTGLNAILTYYYAKQKAIKVNYYTIEAYPVLLQTAKELNYNNFIKEETYSEVFAKMHSVAWNSQQEISESFKLYKIKNEIEKIKFESIIKTKIDIVYYDAFAPTAQSNLWETPVLQKMYNLLKQNGFLITYCAKGSFKRTLKTIGFKVNGLPGPIGKREITQAVKGL